VFFLPYAEDITPIELLRELIFLDHTRLNITIIQYKTKSSEIITISMNDIVNMLNISNVELMNDIRIAAQEVREDGINVINDNIYLFVLHFKHYINNHHSFFDDSYLGEIVFAIKYEDDRFVLQKIFNKEKYILLFSEGSNPNYYAISGVGIESGDILCVLVKSFEGSNGYDIYDSKEIKLIYNGSEFIGNYKFLFELSKKAEPPNFKIW